LVPSDLDKVVTSMVDVRTNFAVEQIPIVIVIMRVG
jgi:hypothetical protein